MCNLITDISKVFAVAVVALAAAPVWALESYIPTEGLQYHVDATVKSSMTVTDYAGYTDNEHIVEWRSDVGSVKLKSNVYDSPIYFANAFGSGRPGLRFGLFDDDSGRAQSLYGSAATTNRTIVYVMKTITPVICMELFGASGMDYGFRMDANGSHYADSHNAGGVCWVNGYAWQPTAYPAAGSPLCYETQVCIDAAPDSIADVAPTKATVGYNKGTYFTSKIAFYDGANMTQRRFTGYYGEIAVYDRQLTADERAMLTLGLMRKWCPEQICTWIGGASGAWSDAANWQGGRVPDATSVVDLTDKTIRVTGEINAALLVLERSSLTVAPRSHLNAAAVYRPAGDTSPIVFESIVPSYLPTAGLQFWMDANDAESVVYDATTKQVTTWASDFGKRVFSSGGKKPHYIAEAFGSGRAGIRFGYDDAGTEDPEGGYDLRKLTMDEATTNRTVVYVVKNLKGVLCMEVLGANGFDWGLRFNADAQHYADTFTTGGWGFVNGYNWLLPIGGSAYPSASDPLCLDTQVCVDVRPDSAADVPVNSSSANATVFTMGIGHYDTIGGPAYGKRFYRGYFGEILAYDRKLTDRERDVLVVKLMQKWCPEKVCTWIGGASGAWETAANWQDGRVPGAESVAVFSNQTVTVSGRVTASVLMLEDGSHVTLASGAVLSAASICSPSGDASVLDYTGDAVYEVPQGSRVTMTIPPTGASRVVMRGTGTLAFAADGLINGIPIVQEGGVIDLNGTCQTFTNILTDRGTVTNTASTRATMVVTATANVTNDIQAPVWGDIAVEKTGAGAVKLPSLSAVTGETVLDAGTLVHDAAFLPADLISGIGLHVDASRPETMTTNAAGYVSKWKDVGGRIIRTYEQWLQNGSSGGQPYFDATAANGKGGVCFGQDADGSAAREASLTARMSIENRTVFIVQTMSSNQRCGEITRGQKGALPGHFGQGASENGIRFDGSNANGWRVLGKTGFLKPSNAADAPVGRMDINGLKSIDGAAGMTDDVPVACDRISLMTVVTPPEKQSGSTYSSYFTPSIGQYYTTFPRFWTGAIHEVIIFERTLSSEELNAVQAGLMKKWGVVPDALVTVTNAFVSPKLVVKGDATLDLTAAPQTAFETVEFDADGASAYPLLTVLGDWDFTGADLSLLNAEGEVGKQKLVQGGNLVGPFKSAVVPHEKASLKYRAHSVWLSFPTGLMLFVR